MYTIDADVVVVGAGPAGVCAAVSCARLGIKTVLASNRPVLGGNSSEEIRVWTRGATGAGNLFAEEMGTWGDFKMRNLYTNLDGNPIFWGDVLLDACLQEPDLTLIMDLHIVHVQKQGNNVASVSGWQVDSEREYTLNGKIFIDCTGDGSIGCEAGVPFHRGKEAREEYGESLAPLAPDHTTQGNSLLYYVKKSDKKVTYIPPAYAYDMETVKKIIGQGRMVKEDFGGSDYWWLEYGGDQDTIDHTQESSRVLRGLIMGIWNYIKNSGEFDADHHTLEWVGNYCGKRESRRMLTDYILTQNDLQKRTDFYDGAFYGGWYMDFHPSDGFNSADHSCEQIPVNLYEVPLRCLYNSQVPNLLFAGRNIGASHVAFASSRTMNTCAQSGQAAGTAAAWCVQSGVLTDEIDRDAATQIRRTLQRDDMLILHSKNDDPDDLARTASVRASSWFDGACGPAVGAMEVGEACFITFPCPENWDVRLQVNAKQDTVLRGVYHFCELPSRYLNDEASNAVEIHVPAGEGRWVTLPEPDGPAGFVTLALEKDPAVSICLEAAQRTGMLCGHSDSPVYGYPCIAAGYEALYGPQNVTNGYHRPWMGPNLWIAGKEPEPWLQLTWEAPRQIEEVRLYLNPDLSKEIPSSRTAQWGAEHRFVAREEMPPELARSFRIEAREGTEWRTVAEVPENWRRMAVITLPQPVRTDALRVVFDAGESKAPPQLFELRAYRQRNWRRER